jgi:hypothetical protein
MSSNAGHLYVVRMELVAQRKACNRLISTRYGLHMGHHRLDPGWLHGSPTLAESKRTEQLSGGQHSCRSAPVADRQVGVALFSL